MSIISAHPKVRVRANVSVMQVCQNGILYKLPNIILNVAIEPNPNLLSNYNNTVTHFTNSHYSVCHATAETFYL